MISIFEWFDGSIGRKSVDYQKNKKLQENFCTVFLTFHLSLELTLLFFPCGGVVITGRLLLWISQLTILKIFYFYFCPPTCSSRISISHKWCRYLKQIGTSHQTWIKESLMSNYIHYTAPALGMVWRAGALWHRALDMGDGAWGAGAKGGGSIARNCSIAGQLDQSFAIWI